MTCKANHVESTDIVDDVNSLLKLRVGDSYRLEHIKQTYIQNQKIWIADEKHSTVYNILKKTIK